MSTTPTDEVPLPFPYPPAMQSLVGQATVDNWNDEGSSTTAPTVPELMGTATPCSAGVRLVLRSYPTAGNRWWRKTATEFREVVPETVVVVPRAPEVDNSVTVPVDGDVEVSQPGRSRNCRK